MLHDYGQFYYFFYIISIFMLFLFAVVFRHQAAASAVSLINVRLTDD